MNQHEKSQVLAKAIDEAVLILNRASFFIDEPDDDCPICIKKAIEVLNNALVECEK